MGLTCTTPATREPLELALAKLHIRDDETAQDELVQSWISAARQHCEMFTRRAFCTQTWTLTLDAFPSLIRVPKPPLRVVNSIKYVDLNGVLTTLAVDQYAVDISAEPGRITPAYGCTWPSTRAQIAAVQVQFDCGYGAPGSVPEALRQPMCLLIGHWSENREAVVLDGVPKELPMAVQSLLWGYRVIGSTSG